LAKAGIYLARLTEELPVKAPNFSKWAHEVSKHPSVTSIFDEDVFLRYTRARIEKARAA
jgi:glutathione S-transferase